MEKNNNSSSRGIYFVIAGLILIVIALVLKYVGDF
jgi:hypothetical protein